MDTDMEVIGCDVKVVSSNKYEQSLAIEWAVPQFMAINANAVFSKSFAADFCEQFKWQLRIVPDGGKLDDKFAGFVSIYLGAADRKVNKVSVNLRISLFDDKGTEFHAIRSKPVNYGELVVGFSWGFTQVISRDDLIANISDGTLVIRAALIFDVPETSLALETTTSPLTSYSDELLQRRSDFRIVIKETQEMLVVHKDILFESWPEFKAMVQASGNGAPLQSWLVENSDYETMLAIVLFMYSRSTAFTNAGVAFKVMRTAYQYGIEQLVLRAASFLEDYLELDRALEVLIEADLLGMQSLKKKCFDLIEVAWRNNPLENKLSAIPGYESFVAPRKLTSELYTHLWSCLFDKDMEWKRI